MKILCQPCSINYFKLSSKNKPKLKVPNTVTEQETYRDITLQKNRVWEKKFCNVPFSRRIVLLPQCLRHIDKCQARDVGNRYECAECGACKINGIVKISRSLGYLGVYILKGGRAVPKIIQDYSPQAILGVACLYEGMLGIEECTRQGKPVQFVSLTTDGCVNTDVNLAELNLVLAK